MRGKRSRYHPYYVSKRSARMRFLAGVGTCLMLIAASACVAYAVFMMLDVQLPVQGGTAYAVVHENAPVHENANPEEEMEAAVEAISWIQVIPPQYEFYITRMDFYEEAYEPFVYAPYVPAVTAIIPATTPPPFPQEYRALSFFIPDNLSLYEAFWHMRWDLDAETVIWKVNASVHLPFYSVIRVNNQPNPLFVTPAYRLPYGFSPESLAPVNHDTCHLRATPETVAAFRALRASAQEAEFDLSVTSAYRTAVRQAELWINGGRRDGSVARPYHSEHQTGRALDLWGPGGLLDAHGSTPTGLWVAANAHNYGFIIRYRAETTHITGYIHEPWHITYVGVEISLYMYENNILSLEEFVGRNPGAFLPLPMA